VATPAETGDMMGVRWRPGSASAAKGATEWGEVLVGRLRDAGGERLTVRLDEGFFSWAMVECLESLGVHYLFKVPDCHWIRRELASWRRYHEGAVVEQRIEELVQFGAGRTAVDDLGGNALLWQMAALSYQPLHVFRTTSLKGSWRVAQPNRLRSWLFRLPAQLTRHARKQYVQVPRGERVRLVLLKALRRTGRLRAPPGLTTAGPTAGLNPILRTNHLGPGKVSPGVENPGPQATRASVPSALRPDTPRRGEEHHINSTEGASRAASHFTETS
jgi:hypothetical protein